MKIRIILFALFLAVLLTSGCTAEDMVSVTSESPESEISSACIQICQNALAEGKDLSKGPCLSDDNPDWAIENWVCDIAHSPRQQIDNEPANQCREFRTGRASHFVELDPECNFIRAV